jgi:hypothetical protein
MLASHHERLSATREAGSVPYGPRTRKDMHGTEDHQNLQILINAKVSIYPYNPHAGADCTFFKFNPPFNLIINDPLLSSLTGGLLFSATMTPIFSIRCFSCCNIARRWYLSNFLVASLPAIGLSTV